MIAEQRAITSKRCLVIMPMSDEHKDRDRYENYNKAYEYVIEPAVSSRGYTVERGGLSPRPGVITPEIVHKVYEADLVVADLTDGNPNVFYEMGIRHAYKKPIIHVCQREESKLPFDISWQRTVFYGFDVEEVKEAISSIQSQIDYLARNPEDFDNPVTLASALFTVSSQGEAMRMLAKEIGRMSEVLRWRPGYWQAANYPLPSMAGDSMTSGFRWPMETVVGEDGTKYGVDQAGRLVPIAGLHLDSSIGTYSAPPDIHLGADGRRYGTLKDGRLIELMS